MCTRSHVTYSIGTRITTRIEITMSIIRICNVEFHSARKNALTSDGVGSFYKTSKQWRHAIRPERSLYLNTCNLALVSRFTANVDNTFITYMSSNKDASWWQVYCY